MAVTLIYLWSEAALMAGSWSAIETWRMTTRHPRRWLASSGTWELRKAVRQSWAVQFQPPPRITRPGPSVQAPDDMRLPA